MKPDVKKIIITNLPYLLFVWLFGKMGEAWRLAAGADASQKMLHFMDSLAAAFANGLPSFHPFDLCIGRATDTFCMRRIGGRAMTPHPAGEREPPTPKSWQLIISGAYANDTPLQPQSER